MPSNQSSGFDARLNYQVCSIIKFEWCFFPIFSIHECKRLFFSICLQLLLTFIKSCFHVKTSPPVKSYLSNGNDLLFFFFQNDSAYNNVYCDIGQQQQNISYDNPEKYGRKKHKLPQNMKKVTTKSKKSLQLEPDHGLEVRVQISIVSLGLYHSIILSMFPYNSLLLIWCLRKKYVKLNSVFCYFGPYSQNLVLQNWIF